MTLAFWGAVGLFTLAFFVTPYLPLIDYHQHVALAAILQRYWAGGAWERQLFDVNLITYNGGFHVIVAALSYLMKAESAGRLVMASYPALLGIAALCIVREAERPRWYALLALPITYSHAMAWGFANWNLTFPVALIAFTWWLRYARGDKAMLPRLLFASMFCAYGHVLGMLSLCVAIGIAQLSRVRELGDSWGTRITRLLATPLPVAPGVLWCVFVYRYQTRQSFSNWEEAYLNGTDDPVWQKLWGVLTYGVGNIYDLSDNILLGLAIALAIYLCWAGPPEPMSTDESINLDLRAIRWLAVSFFAIYLVIPKIFMATWFIYERFPTLAMLFFVGALPMRLIPNRDELRSIAASFAVAAGANTARVWATMGEAREASDIIDDMPPNRKLVAVTYNPTTARISREVFVHLHAVYQSRKQGEVAYTFTKFESMPVHYKRGLAPPSGPGGHEWFAHYYDVHAAWARAYDMTLIHAPDDEDPRNLVFKDEAWRIKLMARRGRFWLYDTSELAKPVGVTVPSKAPKTPTDRDDQEP
ncbi:MAG: hypothetical protein U0165_04760 [Polyangiaceae bacterium]